MIATYSQIYIQYIFAVKGRENLLLKPWREEVFRYIAGIVIAKKHKVIIVNGVEDHVHVFVSLHPSSTVADLVRDIKNNTSNFINKQKYVQGKFSWQEGYGAFSYSKSQVDKVYSYILNQEAHHRKSSFKEEYLDFLKKFELDYDERYLFNWIEK